MKIFLMADMEGASGVVSNDHQARPGGSLYQEARGYLLSDVNAAIEGALEGGAEEVLVFDMHYYGLNLNLDEIHPKCRLIMGKPRKIFPLVRLDQSVKGMMMIGYHAMAQAKGGLITHTYDYSMKKLHLNGKLLGEIGLEAAIAGCYDVPLIMVSGDSKGIEEGETTPGHFEKAIVKYSINEHSALCLPIQETRRLIREKAKRAVENIKGFKPFKVDPPYAIRVEFFERAAAEKANAFPQAKRINEVTVETKGNSLPELWENFIGFYQGYD